MLSENTARMGDEGKAAKRGGAGGFAVLSSTATKTPLEDDHATHMLSWSGWWLD
jgi:hypothetical protein